MYINLGGKKTVLENILSGFIWLRSQKHSFTIQGP